MTHVLMVTAGQRPGFRWPLISLLRLPLGLRGPTRGFSQSWTMEQGATTSAAGKLCGQALLHLPSQDPSQDPAARCWLLQHLPPLTSPLLGPTRPCLGSEDHAGASTLLMVLATEVPAIGWEMGGAGRVSSLLVFLCEKPHSKALLVNLMGQFPRWRSMATGLQKAIRPPAVYVQASPFLQPLACCDSPEGLRAVLPFPFRLC